MELLSSLLIPISIAACGVAMLSLALFKRLKTGWFNFPCVIISVWLMADITIDITATGLNEYWYAAESALYYYLFAATSLMILYHVSKSPGVYPKSLKFSFLMITIVCVAMAMYRWFVQSRWDDGGAEFYYSYGIMLDSAFVYSIVAMDALMIILGVYSALATSTNTDDSMGSERR